MPAEAAAQARVARPCVEQLSIPFAQNGFNSFPRSDVATLARRSCSVNTHTLTFLWTPWSATASALVVLAAAGLCFAAWRRSGYRASIGLLELLRLALVIVAALLLNQPEIVHEYRPEEKPTIAVLWDASPSMETRDADHATEPGWLPPYRAVRRSPRSRMPRFGSNSKSDSKWSCNLFRPRRGTPGGTARFDAAGRSCTARWPRPRPSSRTWSASC